MDILQLKGIVEAMMGFKQVNLLFIWPDYIYSGVNGKALKSL